MAKNETVDVGKDDWTEITDADVTSVTFQVTGSRDVRIMGTFGATAPTDPDDGIVYEVNQGEAARALSDLFPGVAATRVYARSLNGGSKVFISHA